MNRKKQTTNNPHSEEEIASQQPTSKRKDLTKMIEDPTTTTLDHTESENKEDTEAVGEVEEGATTKAEATGVVRAKNKETDDTGRVIIRGSKRETISSINPETSKLILKVGHHAGTEMTITKIDNTTITVIAEITITTIATTIEKEDTIIQAIEITTIAIEIGNTIETTTTIENITTIDNKKNRLHSSKSHSSGK